VATGFLGSTFYASARTQLEDIKKAAEQVDNLFLAKVAIYARQGGYMKDSPALLMAILTARAKTDLEARRILQAVFPLVIDNTKMLRNYVQIVRSGAVGVRCFGSVAKRLIRQWLATRTGDQLFRGSVGQDPSMGDVIKMVHPKPEDREKENLYGYFIGQKYDGRKSYPDTLEQFERFKAGKLDGVPDIPFMFLSSLDLSTGQWAEIARNAPWNTTRMNLNTFKRHDVFKDPEMVKLVAEKLRNENSIRRAKVFPYQLMTAYIYGNDLPFEIHEALQDAMEISTWNIPEIEGQIYIGVDISGSMGMAVTGGRGSATSKVSCRQVAALTAACIARKNPRTVILPFSDTLHSKFSVNTRDSIITMAEQIFRLPSGGTACGLVTDYLNSRKLKGDMVIMLSDNESWLDHDRYRMYGGTYSSVPTLSEGWKDFKRSNRKAKLVCIDLAANRSSQAPDRPDTLNVGGFSDAVFDVVNSFNNGLTGGEHWANEIEKIRIEGLTE
jgi:60 kDa SS-A/Ro ribonucleoprotein